jgi:hypothetical protein
MSELPDHPAVAHEESDVNVRAILGFGAGLLVLAVAVQLFVWWLFGFYSRQADRAEARVFPLAAERQNELPPEPRFQRAPQEDMRALREREQAMLKGYGWVDQGAGVVRIPIEDAMRIVVERGLPARERTK